LAVSVAPAGARGGGGSGSTPCMGGNGTVNWTPSVVWPPNHKLVPITITCNERDGGSSDSNTLKVTGIDSIGVDSQGAGQPSAKQGPDFSGVGDSSTVSDGQTATVTPEVRAERSGTDKAGRTYMIHLSCDSGDDTNGSATAIVTVPHDMGNNSSGSSSSSKSDTGKGKSGSASAPAALSLHLTPVL